MRVHSSLPFRSYTITAQSYLSGFYPARGRERRQCMFIQRTFPYRHRGHLRNTTLLGGRWLVLLHLLIVFLQNSELRYLPKVGVISDPSDKGWRRFPHPQCLTFFSCIKLQYSGMEAGVIVLWDHCHECRAQVFPEVERRHSTWKKNIFSPYRRASRLLAWLRDLAASWQCKSATLSAQKTRAQG